MIASTTQHQLNPQVITLSLSSIIDAQSLETMVLESQRSPKRKVVTQFLDYLDK